MLPFFTGAILRCLSAGVARDHANRQARVWCGLPCFRRCHGRGVRVQHIECQTENIISTFTHGMVVQHVDLLADMVSRRCRRVQYIEFLADTLSAPDYAALLPPLGELVQDFGVDPEVAFKARTHVQPHVSLL